MKDTQKKTLWGEPIREGYPFTPPPKPRVIAALDEKTVEDAIGKQIKTQIKKIRTSIEEHVPDTVRREKALNIVNNLEKACIDMLDQMEIPF